MRKTLILLVLMLHHDSPSYVIYSLGNTLFMVSYTTQPAKLEAAMNFVLFTLNIVCSI